MYKAVTRGISVTVTPRFVSEESSPEEGRFFFAYTVEIINTGLERVQLRSRHWRIVEYFRRGLNSVCRALTRTFGFSSRKAWFAPLSDPWAVNRSAPQAQRKGVEPA